MRKGNGIGIPAEQSLGKKYGNLLVIEIVGVDKQHQALVKCICDCGNEKIATLRLLRRGTTKSCGCLKREFARRNAKFMVESCILNGTWKSPKIGTAKEIFRIRYADSNLSFEEFFELSQMNCYYCGCPPSNKYNTYKKPDGSPRVKGLTPERINGGEFTYNGLDRINSSLGHSKDNVVPCCADCNYAKLERSQEEFFSWIEKVYIKHLKKMTDP